MRLQVALTIDFYKLTAFDHSLAPRILYSIHGFGPNTAHREVETEHRLTALIGLIPSRAGIQ